MNLLDYIATVPDFPKPGILYRDISPLLATPAAFQYAINQLEKLSREYQFTHILGIESRGFIFASALALIANKPLVLVRKPNKLPLAVHRESYGLEYGTDILEMQQSTLTAESKVLMVDDVIATGGTLLAAARLAYKAGAGVAAAVALLEIKFLKGSEALSRQHGICSKSLVAV